MAFSMAGLASTMQGVDIAERQQQADALAANNAKREEVKFKQEQQAAATQAASDAIVLGKEAGGLGSATAKAQTTGQRLMNSVLGLFSSQKSGDTAAQQPASAGINAVPSYGAPTQQTEQSVTPAQADTTAAGNSAAASPAATALPEHRQAKARLDAYALKNPNDLNVIQAAQEKIDGMAIKHRTGLAQRAYEDISLGRNPVALTELYNEHVHDGKTAEEIRYVDENTVAIKLSDGTIFQRPMANIKDFLLQLQKPGSSADLHLQKLTEQSKAEGKLPSELTIEGAKGDQKRKTETVKTDNKIREEKDTGQVGLRTAQTNSANASAGLSSASAGEKNFDTNQKRALAKLTEEINKVDEVKEPSRYKALMKQRDLLLSTKPQKDAEPKVVAEGGSIYNPTTGIWENKEEYTKRITPPPPIIKALPDGAKQIGTSGGKPVFQTPDGKRFVGN